MLPNELHDAFTREAHALIDFGRNARTTHGFGWLDDSGQPDPDKGTHLWITGRMTHSFALGHHMGRDGCLPLVEHGIHCLLEGPLRDHANGGWYSMVDADGMPTAERKVGYDHCFVILAASSALSVGVAGAKELLDAALADFESLWWDEEYRMVLDARDPDGTIDPYRGVNANMHAVEALLAAYAATQDAVHLQRALSITIHVTEFMVTNDCRLPEHFTETWEPLLEYNRDIPADPFRPFGSTIGHWLEWARLILELRAECQNVQVDYPQAFDWLPAVLYRRSLAEGWGANGEPGFLYTVDFAGKPVVEQRMHWVLCEAIGAAASLAHANDDPTYWVDVETYWRCARDHFIAAPGQWVHALSATNQPDTTTWSGKPDIYHALQAMLVGSLPLRPAFAWALAAPSA